MVSFREGFLFIEPFFIEPNIREGAEDLVPPILPAAPPSYNEVYLLKLTKTEKNYRSTKLYIKTIFNFFRQYQVGPCIKTTLQSTQKFSIE